MQKCAEADVTVCRHDLQDSTREVLKSSTGDVKHLGDWRLGPDKVRQLACSGCSSLLRPRATGGSSGGISTHSLTDVYCHRFNCDRNSKKSPQTFSGPWNSSKPPRGAALNVSDYMSRRRKQEWSKNRTGCAYPISLVAPVYVA